MNAMGFEHLYHTHVCETPCRATAQNQPQSRHTLHGLHNGRGWLRWRHRGCLTPHKQDRRRRKCQRESSLDPDQTKLIENYSHFC
jgi:hypothetical protein